MTFNPQPKAPKRIVDKDHVSFLHDLECCLSGVRSQIIVHHLLRCPSRQGKRSGDNHTVPMTDALHKRLHDIEGDELAIFARYGINDPVALAEALYANTGDHSKCIQIIQEARE